VPTEELSVRSPDPWFNLLVQQSTRIQESPTPPPNHFDEQAARVVPADSLVFRTDGPLVDQRVETEKIRLLKLSKEHREQVLGGNILRLAFKAIMTFPQPAAFSVLAKGFDGECPCCRRQFADAS
jgi:hypothetical protein